MKSIKIFCKKLHLCLSGFWIRIWKCLVLTLFFPKFPFDPHENIRKTLVFRCFQGDQKGILGRKGLTVLQARLLSTSFLFVFDYVFLASYQKCLATSIGNQFLHCKSMDWFLHDGIPVMKSSVSLSVLLSFVI